MSDNLKLSILMPVRNEGINIKIILKILNAVVEVPYEVLIVHDTVEDSTIAVTKSIQRVYPEARLIHNDIGLGVINAIKKGVSAAEGEYILLFAVDEVGPVLAIEDMLALMNEGCDFVSCTRYAYGGRRLGGSFIGGTLSRLANLLFFRLSGTAFTDGTTGIKMFKRDIFDKLSLNSNPIGWAAVFEMAIKAELAGMRLGEVPIVSIDRLYGGSSTFSLGPWFREYLRWFFWGINSLRRAKPRQKAKLRIPQNLRKD